MQVHLIPNIYFLNKSKHFPNFDSFEIAQHIQNKMIDKREEREEREEREKREDLFKSRKSRKINYKPQSSRSVFPVKKKRKILKNF